MDKNIPVFGVELTNKEFFYLNKCFLPTPNNGIIYCPEVIETKSVALIEQMFDKKYPLTFDEAKSFVTNSIIFGNYWVLSETSKEIAEKINKDLKLKLLFINMENIEKETSLSLRSLFLQGV
jgi:N-dimethylarginine dimethylaminohydrolase